MTGALCISSHALLYWFQSEHLLKVKESGLSDSLLCSTGSHLMRVSLSLVQMCALCFSPSRSGGCSAVSGPLGWACAGIHAVQKTDANICQGIEWEIDSNWGVEGGSIWSREWIRVDGEDTCGLRNWWAGGTRVRAADWANICVPSMCALSRWLHVPPAVMKTCSGQWQVEVWESNPHICEVDSVQIQKMLQEFSGFSKVLCLLNQPLCDLGVFLPIKKKYCSLIIVKVPFKIFLFSKLAFWLIVYVTNESQV